MSLNSSSHPEGAVFYDMPDIKDEQALAEACDRLVQNGVGVEYAAQLVGDRLGNRGGYEAKIKTPLTDERRRAIAKDVGVTLLQPHAA